MENEWNPDHMSKQDQIVEFLREHDRFLEPIIHEPVVILRREVIDIGPGTRIDSFVKLEGGLGLRIGRCVHIASFAHINVGGGEVVLEDYTAVASGSKIIAGSNLTQAQSLSACAPVDMQRVLRLKTTLKEYAAVYVNSVVAPGVTLHEGAVLAANSIAMDDIPAWQVWGGSPARFLRYRKIGDRWI